MRLSDLNPITPEVSKPVLDRLKPILPVREGLTEKQEMWERFWWNPEKGFQRWSGTGDYLNSAVHHHDYFNQNPQVFGDHANDDELRAAAAQWVMGVHSEGVVNLRMDSTISDDSLFRAAILACNKEFRPTKFFIDLEVNEFGRRPAYEMHGAFTPAEALAYARTGQPPTRLANEQFGAVEDDAPAQDAPMGIMSEAHTGTRFFHGTNSAKLPSILKNGLTPLDAPQSPFRGNLSTIPGFTERMVFVTPIASEALFYARRHASKYGSKPVLLEVDLLPTDKVWPSDDWIWERIMDAVQASENIYLEPHDYDEDGDLNVAHSEKAAHRRTTHEFIWKHPEIFTGDFSKCPAMDQHTARVAYQTYLKALNTPWQQTVSKRDPSVAVEGTISPDRIRVLGPNHMANARKNASRRKTRFVEEPYILESTREFQFITNPTAIQFIGALNRSRYRTLRGIVALTGNTYWWDADSYDHGRAIDRMVEQGVDLPFGSQYRARAHVFMTAAYTPEALVDADVTSPGAAAKCGSVLISAFFRNPRRLADFTQFSEPLTNLLRGLERTASLRPQLAETARPFWSVFEDVAEPKFSLGFWYQPATDRYLTVTGNEEHSHVAAREGLGGEINALETGWVRVGFYGGGSYWQGRTRALVRAAVNALYKKFPREIEELEPRKFYLDCDGREYGQLNQIQFEEALRGQQPVYEGREYPEPGRLPVPEGRVRRYHRTNPANIESIRHHGILRSRSQGRAVGDPVAVWSYPEDQVEEAHRALQAGHAVVEYHVDPAQHESNPYASYTDVKPGQILAIHEPWHQHVRYARENGLNADALRGIDAAHDRAADALNEAMDGDAGIRGWYQPETGQYIEVDRYHSQALLANPEQFGLDRAEVEKRGGMQMMFDRGWVRINGSQGPGKIAMQAKTAGLVRRALNYLSRQGTDLREIAVELSEPSTYFMLYDAGISRFIRTGATPRPAMGESREGIKVPSGPITVLIDPSLQEFIGFLNRAQETYLRGGIMVDFNDNTYVVFWPGYDATHNEMDDVLNREWGWTMVEQIEVEKDLKLDGIVHNWTQYGDVFVREYGDRFSHTPLGFALGKYRPVTEALLTDERFWQSIIDRNPDLKQVVADHIEAGDYGKTWKLADVIAELPQYAVQIKHALGPGPWEVYRGINSDEVDPTRHQVHWTIDPEMAMEYGHRVDGGLVTADQVDWPATILRGLFWWDQEHEISLLPGQQPSGLIKGNSDAMTPDDLFESTYTAPEVLYHGTSEPPEVFTKKGLNPNRPRHRHRRTFLTDNPELALEYAESDQERTGSETITVFGVKLIDLNPAWLRADPDHYSGEDSDWVGSLRDTDQCAYVGVIPPNHLRVVGQNPGVRPSTTGSESLGEEWETRVGVTDNAALMEGQTDPMVQRAIDYFGTTRDWRECGFVVPFQTINSLMLDLSGKRDHNGYEREMVPWGTPTPRAEVPVYRLKPNQSFDDLRGQRYADHTEIGNAVPEIDAGGDSRAHIIEFMRRTGSVRAMPGHGIGLTPQVSRWCLNRALKELKGHGDPIQVDLTTDDWIDHSRQFNPRISVDGILKWIRGIVSGRLTEGRVIQDRAYGNQYVVDPTRQQFQNMFPEGAAGVLDRNGSIGLGSSNSDASIDHLTISAKTGIRDDVRFVAFPNRVQVELWLEVEDEVTPKTIRAYLERTKFNQKYRDDIRARLESNPNLIRMYGKTPRVIITVLDSLEGFDEYGTLLKEGISEARETIDQIDVLVDPTANEFLGALNRSLRKRLRGLWLKDQAGQMHVVVWDAYLGLHSELGQFIHMDWGWHVAGELEFDADLSQRHHKEIGPIGYIERMGVRFSETPLGQQLVARFTTRNPT